MAAALTASVLSPEARSAPAPSDDPIALSVVDPHTGTARVTIPIEVPPGPGGLVPRLGLVYSSAGGDGPYGVGWSLPLGEIRCTARFGVPDYTNCPKYEWNGQLLVSDEDSGAYHAFTESFHRIVNLGTGGWAVTAPDGTIQRYGTTPGSRIQVPAGAGAVTAVWLLSQIEDVFGNTVSITYSADPGGTGNPDAGMAYPTLITYAGGTREVRFLYEYRPDSLYDFAGGIERRVRRRLTEIQVLSFEEEVFQRRLFGYSLPNQTYATGRSRLAWTQLFGIDCPLSATNPLQPPQGQCQGLPRQEFDYTDPSDSITSAAGSQWEAVPDTNLPHTPPVLGAPWVPTGLQTPIRFADVNGDGLVDYVEADLRNYRFEVVLRRANGWERPVWEDSQNETGPVNEAAFWTDNLRGLSYPAPTFDNTETCGGDPFGTFAAPVLFGDATSLTGHGQPLVSTSGPDILLFYGTFQLVDLDGDRRADLAASMRLDGGHEYCGGGGPDPVGFEEVRVVFRNTGSGWVLDEDLAEDLPPFEYVRVENKDFAVHEYTRYYNHEAPWPHPAMNVYSPTGGSDCADANLMGDGVIAGYDVIDLVANFCAASVNLSPSFQDLDGDGQVDLVVAAMDDPAALWVENDAGNWMSQGWGDVTLARSHAWSRRSGEWSRLPELDPPLHHTLLIVHGEDVDWSAQRAVDRGVRFADMNRDGLADIVTSNYVALNRGRGDGTPHSAWCASRGTFFDLDTTGPEVPIVIEVCPEAQRFEPPAGLSFVRIGSDYGSSLFVGTGLQLADLNGDGWIDLAYAPGDVDDGTQSQPPYNWGELRTWLHSSGAPGSAWVLDSRFAPPVGTTVHAPALDATMEPDAVRLFDENGDGATDFVQRRIESFWGGPAAFVSYHSKSHRPDLLKTIRNGRGGTIAIEYQSVGLQRDDTLGGLEELAADDGEALNERLGAEAPPSAGEPPVPYVPTVDDVPTGSPRGVVSKVTVEGPGRATVATTFRYGGERYAPAHRAPLGFRLSKRTRPDGSTVSEFFYQNHGRTGRLSRLEVADTFGRVLYRETSRWDYLAAPTLGTDPSPSFNTESFVARLTESRSRIDHVEVTGGVTPGAETRRTITYDDTYGYGFVAQVVEERPTGTLTTVFTPWGADQGNWVVRRVGTRQEKDGSRLLGQTEFTYASGSTRPATITELVQNRDNPGAPDEATTLLEYDSYGNLIAATDAEGNLTEFCFDGDAGWCPSPSGQTSHSVRVGIREHGDVGGQPETWVTTIIPEAASGRTLVIDSAFEDEPTVRFELDPFGRVRQEYVTPQGGGEVLRAETSYHDDLGVSPWQETWAYSDAAGTQAGWSATVFDAFGSVWKQIARNAPGITPPYHAVVTHQNGATRVLRETYPVACGGDLQPIQRSCPEITGAVEEPATTTALDLLGRPVSVETEDGTSTFAYRAPAELDEPDRVLAINAKGDVSERAVDGDRVAWVAECEGLSQEGDCASPVRTEYTFDPTGEITQIRQGANLNPSPPPLVYRFDTRGQVVEIDDPDGGTSFTTYNLAGNVVETENAREQVTTYAWDELGRLTDIDRPEGENDIAIAYRPTERQRATVTAEPEGAQSEPPWGQEFLYDALGRVARESLYTRYGTTQTLLLDTTFDLQGRPVTIRYPDTQTIVRYEYIGAYLSRVCEVPGVNDTCAHEDAASLVSQVDYDDLGRVGAVHTPAGVQSYEFTAATQRLWKDHFIGATSGSYQRKLTYTARDALGNVLSVDDAGSNGAVEFSGSFAYDSRNRLTSWTKGGASTVHFRFDALGNLVGHEASSASGPESTNQTFGDASHPHRITAASHSGGLGFTHDADGNLATQTNGSGQLTRQFTFDSQNRLTCVGTSASAPCNRLEVAYDAEGRRVHETSATVPATESFFLGDLFTLEYRDGSGIDRAIVHVFALGREIVRKPISPPALRTAETSWLLPGPLPELPTPAVGLLLVGGLATGVWLGFVLVPVLAGRPAHPAPARAAAALALAALLVHPSVPAKAGGGGGTIFERNWLISDSLGSAQAMVAEDGWIVRETSFKPFGKVDQDVYGANPPKVASFAGHRLEPATDLYYMQARWMNPVTGTFLSVDPLVADAFDPQSVNAYAYARNNPVTFTDPTGMCGEWSCGGGGNAHWVPIDFSSLGVQVVLGAQPPPTTAMPPNTGEALASLGFTMLLLPEPISKPAAIITGATGLVILAWPFIGDTLMRRPQVVEHAAESSSEGEAEDTEAEDGETPTAEVGTDGKVRINGETLEEIRERQARGQREERPAPTQPVEPPKGGLLQDLGDLLDIIFGS